MGGYNEKSCNALEKPFYRPVEAALRWCGLIEHEGEILGKLDSDGIPKTGQFPDWPCLQANTERILDAIVHGKIDHGRDGKTVGDGDHVAKPRVTVRHTDLREWMNKYHPGQNHLSCLMKPNVIPIRQLTPTHFAHCKPTGMRRRQRLRN